MTWGASLCQWPGCDRYARSIIGTTLVKPMHVCGRHRRAWLELTLDELARLQPTPQRRVGGNASAYYAVNPSMTLPDWLPRNGRRRPRR